MLTSFLSQAQGQERQKEGQAEHDASHAAAKLGNYSVSSSGAVTKDNPDRSAGQWNQTVGAAKESLGGLVGSQSLKQSGRQQNLEGQQQEAQGQLTDFAAGVGNRVQGAVGGAVAGFTGDQEGQKHYEQLHAEGKTRQRGAEYDIQKEADARQDL